jgi:hypothetical protein
LGVVGNSANATEEHRHACEVAHVAAMKSDNERRLYLAGVHTQRGEVAWKRLRQDVWTAMQRVAA